MRNIRVRDERDANWGPFTLTELRAKIDALIDELGADAIVEIGGGHWDNSAYLLVYEVTDDLPSTADPGVVTDPKEE